MPVFSWLEVVECFDEATAMFKSSLDSWIQANDPTVGEEDAVNRGLSWLR